MEGNLSLKIICFTGHTLFNVYTPLVVLQRDSTVAEGRVANCRSNGGLALTVPGGHPLVPETQYSSE